MNVVKREILIEIILALVIILLIVAIREIRMVRSEFKQTQITQPFPTVQITILQTPTSSSIQAFPTVTPIISPSTNLTPYQMNIACTNDNMCAGSWCTDAEPPSCYEEKCINGKCQTVQTSWHGTRQ